jgi:thioredoxin-like negative regulator of GroEL
MNPVDNLDVELDALLLRVKDDEVARREYLDILETMGPIDPRTAKYRKLLTQKLF